ncbi:HNH endonuclease [Methanococcus sp. CF]
MSYEELAVGNIISNNKIHEIFGGGTEAGMRYSTTTETLVLISNPENGLYVDEWHGGVLHYTGMGRNGDQELKGPNKRLYESNEMDLEVYLFEKLEPNKYEYKGQFELSKDEKPYQKVQNDANGDLRKVWIFPIKIKNQFVITPRSSIQKSYDENYEEARSLSIGKLALETKGSDLAPPVRMYSKNYTYIRDPKVALLTKKIADGFCQLCKKEAPFDNKLGEPYLETHHVKWLSKGGLDTVTNTVALCPNCHKKIHILNLKEDTKKLREIAVKNALFVDQLAEEELMNQK